MTFEINARLIKFYVIDVVKLQKPMSTNGANDVA